MEIIQTVKKDFLKFSQDDLFSTVSDPNKTKPNKSLSDLVSIAKLLNPSQYCISILYTQKS